MKANKYLIFRFIATLVFWSVFFLPAIFVPRILQYKTLWPIFCNLFLFAAKVKAYYMSPEIDLNKQGSVMYACNHKSLVDTYIIVKFLRKPFTIVFKKEMLENPAYRFMSWKMALVPMDRNETSGQIKAIAKIKKMISKKHSVIFFPEGYHIIDEKIAKLKRGVAKIAKETGIEVVPMAIYGIKNTFIYEKVRMKNAYLKAGKGIKYSDYGDDEAFIAALRSKIEALYDELEKEFEKNTKKEEIYA
jgi:1-acyl-sn-glycerol-3-phosphate acyltransferase